MCPHDRIGIGMKEAKAAVLQLRSPPGGECYEFKRTNEK